MGQLQASRWPKPLVRPCPLGAWRWCAWGRPASGSQSLMVLNPLWWLPRPWGKGRRRDDRWWLTEKPAPWNPQGEPLGVSNPELLSLEAGDTHPPGDREQPSLLTPHLRATRWPWGDGGPPHSQAPAPPGKGAHWPFGGPWTHWYPSGGAQWVQQWHCKKVSFYKRKRKNKWWFFLIKNHRL